MSRFSQSLFYCCSRQGQERSEITLSTGGNRLGGSRKNLKFCVGWESNGGPHCPDAQLETGGRDGAQKEDYE